jgi:hypothetical protein
MEKKNLYKALPIVGILLIIGFGCCHKTTQTTPTALFGFHMHTYIGDSALLGPQENELVADSNGRLMSLSYAQFYITSISLHSSTTNKWYTIPNSLMMKRVEYEEYVIGNVPADSYDDIKFTVGLNNTLNSGAPSSYPTSGADSVLSTAESFMYYGAGQGYKFMALAGMVDTSSSHNGSGKVPFNYSFGGNGDTVVITLPMEAFSMAPNLQGVQLVHVIADYGKLLQNINMNNPANWNGNTYGTGSQPATATTIMQSVINMFRYECTSPTTQC